ncbi:ATP-grasp domain-containing protein [Pseudomonas aeruginosa]|nr:ATP-grasp domain-containing protein [Pseudomonas aeruginosa]
MRSSASSSQGRDRPVRRPDPAEALPRPRRGRRADHRHQPGRHRPCRRPRALPADGPAPEPAPAGQRHRAQRDEALAASKAIGYPLVVRPSYVLGGRAMEIVYQEEELKRYMREAVQVSNDSPVLLDHFLNCAIEVDIDAVCDGEIVVIGAIMQHIEQAGVHSGDSACSLPPYSLPQHIQDEIREQVKKMALELGVVGLMNVQMAVQGEDIFVIEVNPRASRTVPFVSKCVGESLAKVAARVMAGKTLAEVGFTRKSSRRSSASRKRCSRSPSSPASIRSSARK